MMAILYVFLGFVDGLQQRVSQLCRKNIYCSSRSGSINLLRTASRSSVGSERELVSQLTEEQLKLPASHSPQVALVRPEGHDHHQLVEVEEDVGRSHHEVHLQVLGLHQEVHHEVGQAIDSALLQLQPMGLSAQLHDCLLDANLEGSDE